MNVAAWIGFYWRWGRQMRKLEQREHRTVLEPVVVQSTMDDPPRPGVVAYRRREVCDECGKPAPHGCHAGCPPARQARPAPSWDICDNCGSGDLVPVHGCVRCQRCGWKADCGGW